MAALYGDGGRMKHGCGSVQCISSSPSFQNTATVTSALVAEELRVAVWRREALGRGLNKGRKTPEGEGS